MALKFITAEEAAALVKNDDNVGFSGFTHAGCPKVVPVEIAKGQKQRTQKARFPRSAYLQALPEMLLTVHCHVRKQSNFALLIKPTRICAQR